MNVYIVIQGSLMDKCIDEIFGVIDGTVEAHQPISVICVLM